jgi:hypothetical protein
VNPGGGGPIVTQAVVLPAARWQGTQTTVAGLYVNKNAATRRGLRPRPEQPGVLPCSAAPPRVTWQITQEQGAGFYEHQYRA